MQELTKVIQRQDAFYKLSPSSSNETSVNLSTEISSFISDESGEVTFTIYKEDLVKAISALCLIPKVYKKKEQEASKSFEIMTELYKLIDTEFGNSATAEYTVNHFKRDDGRSYFNNLKMPNGFNIRSFLVEQYSLIHFIKSDEGKLSMRLETRLPEDNIQRIEAEPSSDIDDLQQPLQQIFFGAPGTGKSFKINEMCAKYENYRTTFHPDTDYATFVGSYKPITKRVPQYDIYHNVIIDKETNEPVMEDRIVYRYVFQAFLKAYIAAWKEQQNPEPKPVFLVIEEINRGNCAQIFGDIFQLLDRNESGYSDYPIVADDDLAQELKREFEHLAVANPEAINTLYKGGKDVVGSVKEGIRLLLPNNLYIWATMNTSDQSLFPIDSAFKRRWDWKYIKIKDNAKKYKIVFTNGNVYDWWQFVEAINYKIENGEIQQEDKKLGYFFAKSKDGKISAERFLSKVIFYLYNDVFKDFGFDEDYFKGADGKPMTFASYFDEAGDANEAQIELFLNNLGLKPIEVEDETNGNPDDKVFGLTVNGRKMQTITQAVFEILSVAARSDSFEEISDTVANIFTDRDDVVKAIDNPDTYTKENRWNKTPIIANDGTAFVVSNQWLKEYMPQVKELAETYNVTFDIVGDEAMSSDDGDDDDVASSKALTVKWPDGTFVNDGRKNTYVKTLEMMGIERVAEALKGRFRLGDVPIVSKEPSPKIENHNHFRYEKVGDYYVIVSLSNAGSILRSLSKKFGLDLTVTGR